MSIETWKAEFYPESAYEVAKRKNEIACIEHSLKKWEGISHVNLKSHHVIVDGDMLTDIGVWVLPLNSDSCALCCYDEIECENGDEDCSNCPIKKVTGDNCYDEWEAFIENGDVKPMQKLLQHTLDHYKEEK